MSITLIAAGLIAIIHVILVFNVGWWRGKTKIHLGTGTSEPLMRAVRAHGNNAEYAPLLIILLGLLEFTDSNYYVVLSIGILSVLARALHGYGLGFTDGRIRFFRFAGTMLTVFTLLIGGILSVLAGYGLL